jgi:flagellar hook-associated protein 3 FlgL
MVALSRIALNQAVERQSRLSRDIAILETAIATGRALTAPSQAPEQWAELSEVSRRRADIVAVRTPLATGTARARAADRWLGSLTDTLVRARELVVASGGTPGGGRSALVAELTAMRDDLAARFAETGGSGVPVIEQAEPLVIALGDGRTTRVAPQLDEVQQLPGGGTLTAAFDAAIAAAASGNGADIATALTALDHATGHIANEQARQGIRLQRLEEADVLLSAIDADLEARQSELRDTDIAAAITHIQTLAVQRDAARAMLSRTASQTLFDYLR